MTPYDLDFDRDGAVVIRGAYDAAGVADQLWDFLRRRYKHARDDRSTWTGKLGKGLSGFPKGKPFDPTPPGPAAEAIDAILGPGWEPEALWRPLVTFPTGGPGGSRRAGTSTMRPRAHRSSSCGCSATSRRWRRAAAAR